MRILGLALLALTSSSCIVVVATSCSDGIINGDETDVDCGGRSCAPCGDGRGCISGQDCVAGVCNGGRCGVVVTPTCSDGIQNGSETGIDCGGSCPSCVNHPLGADAPFPPGNTTSYQITPDVAVSVAAGVQAGYGITTATGDAFQLYWTGYGQSVGMFQEFWGSIYTPGAFSNVSTGCSGSPGCPIEADDFVSQPYAVAGGERIDFDTFAIDEVDGIGFTVNVEPVFFDLYIDGQHRPMEVFFQSTATGQIANVAVIPFALGIN